MKAYWKIALWMVGMAMVANGSSQNEPAPGPAYLVMYIKVMLEASGNARNLLRTLYAASRKSEGVTHFDALQRRERLHHFTIVETWRDVAARDANLAAAHTKQFRETIQPLLIAGWGKRPHGGLDVGPANAAAGAMGAMVFTVHTSILFRRKKMKASPRCAQSPNPAARKPAICVTSLCSRAAALITWRWWKCGAI